MKKISLLAFVLVTILTLSLVLASCSGTTITPGAAWAETERLTYEIIRGESIIGTYVTEITKLEAGEHYLKSVRENPFTISSSATRGIRLTQTVTFGDKVVMKSESLLNGFSSIASYKKIDDDTTSYEVRGYLDGKKYKYWKNDEKEVKISVKDDFIDNELLYTSFRIYDEIDTSYSKSIKVIDPLSGKKESFSFATQSKKEVFDVNYLDASGEKKMETYECIVANISKTTTPTGNPIVVWYTPRSFTLYGNATKAGNYSYHIPVVIIENDLTYKLLLAEAN